MTTHMSFNDGEIPGAPRITLCEAIRREVQFAHLKITPIMQKTFVELGHEARIYQKSSQIF